MREVFDALDRLGVDWFVTGSEAAACYGVLRQTFDTDVVVDLPIDGFDRLARDFPDYAVADPISYDTYAMGSIISPFTADKVDLIMRQPDSHARQVMARRRRCGHHAFGEIWVCSLEDLVIAKLEWSEGTSELQLRDCAQLLRMNSETTDWAYLEETAKARGVADLLEQARHAP